MSQNPNQLVTTSNKLSFLHTLHRFVSGLAAVAADKAQKCGV